jgi:serine/threonine protein kinase
MIGRIIKGKYKIYDEVGSGGFATVYLGRNMETNEIVAIKILGERYTHDFQYIERFRREAGLAERLRHPNVVRVLDHGIEDHIHFLVMEFVEGLTLDKILMRKGRLPVEDVISYMEQACAGLQAAYRAGIVHRDIKPTNLMITPEGTVKIMDFGIARVEAMTGLTQSGEFIGTPRYMAPESATGLGVDIRSDIYALGLVMYEMLAGEPAFEAETPLAVLHMQVEAQPRRLRQTRPDVPPWLEAIVMRALAKDPAKRFQNPAEMLAALGEQAAAAQRPSAVTPPIKPAKEAAVRPPKPERKGSRGLILGLAAAAVIVALGLVALLILSGGGKATPTAVAERPPEQTPTALSTDTPIIRVVTNTPGQAIVPTATELPLTDTITPSPTVTQELVPTDTSIPPTDTLVPSTDTPMPPTNTPIPPTNTPKPTTTPTRAPTNTSRPTGTATSPPPPALTGRIAFSVGGTLYVVDVRSKGTLFTIPGMRQPDFRRDGAEILADGLANPATLVNIDANAGRIIREQTKFTDDFHPSWSPDGTRFAYDSLHHGLGQYTMLYTQGLTGSKPQAEVTLYYNGQQIRGHSTVWMQNDMIAFTGCDYWPGGTGGSKCGIYAMPSWSDRPNMIHPGSVDMRATDNDGTFLVFMSQETGDWEVFVVPSQGGAARNLSQSPSSLDGLGTFSPDGKRVAFVSNRGGRWAIWVVNLDGSGLTKLLDLPGKPTDPWYDDNMSWGP